VALKVLLADDSVPAQNMGKKILADAGYEVTAVSNGLEALKKIADNVPDIAILDIFMPGYTGLEVCSRLRGNSVTAELPVILTVGKLEPYRPEEGEKVHSNAVIVKPFASEELISAVRSLVGLPFAMRPEVAAGKPAAAVAEPVPVPEPEDDYEEEAPMLSGIGFEGVSSAAASDGLGWDPDAKRTPFSASAAFSASSVEKAPAAIAELAVSAPARKTVPAVEAPAVASVFTDFEIEPATTAAGSAATATALVEWWQPAPEAVEEHAIEPIDAAEFVLAGGVEPVASAKASSPEPAADEARPVQEIAVQEIPAQSKPARAIPAEHGEQTATEAPVPDRESRMQAFEALFNSDVAIPVEENPAALPDLLAQEELEALQQEDEGETASPLALDGLEQGLPIATAQSTGADPLEASPAADVIHELQLDDESIANWLTTGEIPHEPEPPVAAASHQDDEKLAEDPRPALENAPAQAAPECDSLSAGIPEPLELPKTATETSTVEATAPMVCYLPKEPAPDPAGESSFYASLEPDTTGFAFENTVAARTEAPEMEAPQVEAPEIEALPAEAEELHASPHPEAVHPSAEEVASATLEQEFSEIVELEAEAGQTIDENVEVQESVHATANGVPGEAKRIHQAVESVFERFRPLLIAAIARELTRRE
jgi:CheY-like chemotaxis protein